MTTRSFPRTLVLAAGLAIATLGGAVQAADDFPNKPMRLVVNFSAGGTTDVLARALGNAMSSRLGQTVIVDNKPGALGAVGAGEVARSPNDGYTMLITTQGSLIEIPVIKQATPYDPQKDLKPVSLVAEQPFVLFASGDFPADNVEQLISYAKTQPKGVDISVSGSSVQLGTYALAKAAGIDLVHIPYGGVGPIMTAAIGGISPLALNAATSALLQHVEAGKLKFLGVASPGPYTKLPGVPPISDTLPGYQAVIWWGVFVPGDTPDSVVEKLNLALKESLEDDSVRKVLDANILSARTSTPVELAKIIDDGLTSTRKLVKENNIPVE